MLKKLGNKGTSTVFGSILFIILALTLVSILFVTLYSYNYSIQEALRVEEERMQEKIVLSGLATQNLSGTEYVTAFFVNNSGSITSRIRAVYIDSEFLCDPSDSTINPDGTYINPKESLWILLPPGVKYEAIAKMTVATERGIKSAEYEWMLKHGGENPPPSEQTRFYFGPLMLDFNKFYYTECNPKNGSYDPSTWKPGWSIEIGTGSIAWNITVKNVDDRNITINQFSCFTLVPNDEPAERRPWYIEPPEGSFTQFIASNETVNIIYIWKTPKMKQTSPQSIYTTVCRNKVFLTFFGVFHEHDGTTKPYGQTIPFEAVLCVRTGGTIEISASPTIILANSTMKSTITAKVYNKHGNPVANANVTFSTDLGTLSSLWAITDANGTATVTLYPSALPGIANVTATWQGLRQSTSVIINGVPVALFRESAETVYTGEVISFNASDSYDPDGSIASYFWDFGDGTNATGILVTHSYVENGVCKVTLTVTDNLGATGSTSATKTVLNRPPVASFTESAETVLTREMIFFNASSSYDPDGKIVTYSWTFGDGTSASEATVSHAYADNGVYIVTLTVTDNDGATGMSTATKTVLNRPPIASFTESASTVLTDEIIHFNASSSYDSDGSIIRYSWIFGDGTNATGVTVDHAYIENGVYNVTLAITDNDGATSAATATKTVLNRAPVTSFTESATIVLTKESITFNASSSYDPDGSIVSYMWNFGDVNITTVTSPIIIHVYSENGTYTVTLTVKDNDGATSSSSSTKTVLNRPPVAIFTESATTVLTGEVIDFNASGSYDLDGYIISYFWTFGDGTNATGITVSHAYADNGVYAVTLTIKDDDGTTTLTTATKTVLNRPPVASFAESVTTVLTGEAIRFNASASYDPDGTIVSYFWTFGDGTNAIGVTVSHAYSENGVYTVTLTVTDNDGETGTATAVKTVLNRLPIASFTESATTVYTGVVIRFNASTSYDLDGSIVNFFWSFGDGRNATDFVVDHAYSDNGIYTVTLTITDNDGGTATATATKTVLNRGPVASLTESATTVLTGEVIYFNASASHDLDGSIVSFFWNFGDETNATGVAVAHAYADNGTYVVTLTVTDNDNDTASTSTTITVLNRSPFSSFTESAATVYTSEIIYFNASSSYDLDGSVVNYFWSFGDGTNATGIAVDHAYVDDGTYTVTLTVTDNDGATNSTNATKTVLNRPPAASFTESAETVNTNELIHFNASASYDSDGTIVSYLWNFSDGSNATSAVVDHFYTDDGNYVVTLTVTDDDGSTVSANATKTVLNRSPVALFTESAHTVRINETIYFNASDSYDPDGTIVNYFWDFGDGTNSTGVTTSHSYTSDGTYIVTLTVTDDDGVTASANATKTILLDGGSG